MPHRSGFISLEGENFTISIAEDSSVALLEYSGGVFRERCIAGTAFNLGNLQPRLENHLTFEEALTKAMNVVASENLGYRCCDLLTSSEVVKGTKVIRTNFHGASTEITLGPGKGALLKYSHTYPLPNVANTSKRVTCTFSVLTSGGS